MEESLNENFRGNEFINMTVTMDTNVEDVRTLATSYLMFQIGKSLLLFSQVKQINCRNIKYPPEVHTKPRRFS